MFVPWTYSNECDCMAITWCRMQPCGISLFVPTKIRKSVSALASIKQKIQTFVTFLYPFVSNHDNVCLEGKSNPWWILLCFAVVIYWYSVWILEVTPLGTYWVVILSNPSSYRLSLSSKWMDYKWKWNNITLLTCPLWTSDCHGQYSVVLRFSHDLDHEMAVQCFSRHKDSRTLKCDLFVLGLYLNPPKVNFGAEQMIVISLYLIFYV